jgi:hypothetical protein
LPSTLDSLERIVRRAKTVDIERLVGRNSFAQIDRSALPWFMWRPTLVRKSRIA